MDAGADGRRAVGEHLDVDAGRDPALQVGEHLFDAVDGVEDVGIRLLADDQQHRGPAVEHGDRTRVAGAVGNICHARQAHDVAGARLDDDGAIVLRIAQLRIGIDGHRLRVALDDADRS